MSARVRRAALCVLLASACARIAHADPWIAPGDSGLRHDIELLADAGVLRGPVTTWPISWPDVARDVLAMPHDGSRPAVVEQALTRVQTAARRASARGASAIGTRLSAAHEPIGLRSFGDSPREEGEISLRAGWLGDRVALNLQATAVVDPDDGRELRADGSYVGVNIGNFMISAGYMERWWGPGWDGSLILSTNARPIPSLTIERNYTDAFKNKLLSWSGPWRASIAVGEAEQHDVAVPRVRFLAARVNFKPRPWLELGLSRTAQWCGGERVCDLETFGNLLIGRDNRDGSLDATDEPGNQMAGYDARVRSPWAALPVAFYTQWIGEDEAGGLPSKFIGLAGLEFWGGGEAGSWRLRGEYTDTACVFTRENPQLNCAYRNGIYPQGYTYRRRIIGHALDNDSRMYSVGALWAHPDGGVYQLVARRVELNRDGGPHAISDVPMKVNNVELRASRSFGFGKIAAGLGFDDRSPSVDSASSVQVFLSWQQGY
jgi:hypothetical protein